MLTYWHKLDRKTQQNAIRYATHILAWLPFLYLYYQWYNYLLGADEERLITLRLGKWGLIFLLASLAITPLNTLLGWKQLIPIRKTLGLYSFWYILGHLISFSGIEYDWDLRLVIEEIILRRYAVVGFLAFLLLLALAITSNKWSQKQLKKNWKRLHKWVYVAGILGIIHFFWLVKNAYNRPIFYGSILAVLLLMRTQPVKQKMLRLQRRFR